MKEPPERTNDRAIRINDWLPEHAVLSTALVVWALVTIYRVLLWLDLPEGDEKLFGWITLAMALYTPVLVATVPRFTKQPADRVIVLRWVLSYVPFEMAMVSAFSKGPQWPLMVTLIESGLLVVLTMVAAKRARPS